MTEKEKIIQAFKNLDFESLNNLLDDNRSYMKVPKSVFISSIKNFFEKKKYTRYEKVTEGVCNHCHNGSKVYHFSVVDTFPLNLVFEEKDNKVIDIQICRSFKLETEDENDWNIYFPFYEEDKVDFKPSIEYFINLQRIEKAVEAFNKLESLGLVTVQDILCTSSN